MPDYINPNGYTVHLTGPDGRVVRVKSRQTLHLPPFFDKYRQRGMIKLLSEANQMSAPSSVLPTKLAQSPKPPQRSPLVRQPQPAPRETPQSNVPQPRARKAIQRQITNAVNARRDADKIVGKITKGDANDALKQILSIDSMPISNNIGIGILSYNRISTLKRLIESIINNTNLDRTTVFISDDGSSDPSVVQYLSELKASGKFVVLQNTSQLGIAANTNRLLRCLIRFDYALLLNDDTEVLSHNWEYFYVNAMKKTGFKHFIHREPGIYGAQAGESVVVSDVTLQKVTDKPQGAILAFDTNAIDAIGYFDESYGIYGMEHVDWSTKIYEAGLQQPGFFDVAGSHKYFKLHNEKSSVESKAECLRRAKDLFSSRTFKKCEPTPGTSVPAVSVVIPYRELQRNESLKTIIENIRASRFPVIDIALVEQDDHSKVSSIDLGKVTKILVPNGRLPLFNKSLAFNVGVQNAIYDKVILHDADIIATAKYVDDVYNVLNNSPACHIGKTVVYANQETTHLVNADKTVSHAKCERIVGYFEGGSLAVTKSAYWQVGGFNEDFYGYGCEDCEFFARLSSISNFCNSRVHGFLHLWHPRADNWNAHHNDNKALERNLCIMPMELRIQQQVKQTSKYQR